jgi:hypothetical protein
MVPAKSWDEYYEGCAEMVAQAIDQIAPASGFLFTPRIFAARPGIMPEWDINMGYGMAVNLSELAIYPPEYEDSRYHSVKWEGNK